MKGYKTYNPDKNPRFVAFLKSKIAKFALLQQEHEIALTFFESVLLNDHLPHSYSQEKWSTISSFLMHCALECANVLKKYDTSVKLTLKLLNFLELPTQLSHELFDQLQQLLKDNVLSQSLPQNPFLDALIQVKARFLPPNKDLDCYFFDIYVISNFPKAITFSSLELKLDSFSALIFDETLNKTGYPSMNLACESTIPKHFLVRCPLGNMKGAIVTLHSLRPLFYMFYQNLSTTK